MSFPICMCLSGACTSVALKGKQVRAKSCDRSICTVSVSSLERIQWHIEFLVGVPYVQMGLWDHKTPEIQSFTPHDCFLDVWFPKSVYSPPHCLQLLVGGSIPSSFPRSEVTRWTFALLPMAAVKLFTTWLKCFKGGRELRLRGWWSGPIYTKYVDWRMQSIHFSIPTPSPN